MALDPASAVTGGASGTRADWTRDEWLASADRLLAGARRWASVNGARITPPGVEGGYGNAVDGLEGFARTFLLAGFRIAGARGEGVDELIAFYSKGVAAGVDPAGVDRWVRLDEHAQAKVEAASVALILDLTREWIWDRFDKTTQQRVIDYLAPAVGDQTYPRTNWLWFRLVVQTFLRSVGGPWSPQDVADDLALHDSFARADGWLSDGDERSFDHYVGWALHLYPVLWSRMQGAAELAAGRTAKDITALDRFLLDAVELVGADGSPLLQGRSLIYRFAAAAPFWVGVIAEVPSLAPGLLRHAADRIVGHFGDHGVPDGDDLLSMGWHHEWRGLAQSYSGPGSPYWATKGYLGIALPADHPVWVAESQPLPVEAADTLRAIVAPGWVLSGTRADGIVRIVNHGTDHAAPDTLVGDSPLYARIGYSTVAAPLFDEEAWLQPLEQSVALVDEQHGATHRAAMRVTETRVDRSGENEVGVASSVWPAHWVTPDETTHLHGSGREGTVLVAGQLSVVSLVRGVWELRLVRVDSLAAASTGLRLRVGGWAVTGEGVRGSIHAVLGSATETVTTRRGASPLGDVAVVRTLEFPAEVGTWVAACIELAGASTPLGTSADARIAAHPDHLAITVSWPDGHVTETRVTDPRSAITADGP